MKTTEKIIEGYIAEDDDGEYIAQNLAGNIKRWVWNHPNSVLKVFKKIKVKIIVEENISEKD
jgi:hypothetical protein